MMRSTTTRSHRGPKAPSMPMMVPARSEPIIPAPATSSEMRPPKRTRATRSRPMASVPKGWASEGGRRTARRSIAVGPRGWSSGAQIAARITSASSTTPATNGALRGNRRRIVGCAASRAMSAVSVVTCQTLGGPARRWRDGSWLFQADAWIDPGIEQVDQQVDDDEGGGGDDGDALDQRIVAGIERGQREFADAGKIEDHFGDDHTAEEIADIDTDDRQQRQRGVLQGIDEGDAARTDAEGMRGADVFFFEHGLHRAAQDAQLRRQDRQHH